MFTLKDYVDLIKRVLPLTPRPNRFTPSQTVLINVLEIIAVTRQQYWRADPALVEEAVKAVLYCCSRCDAASSKAADEACERMRESHRNGMTQAVG